VAQQVTITETAPPGRPPAAVTAADRDAAGRYIGRGNELFNASQWVRAATQYRLALGRDPFSAEAHEDLADALYYGGQVDLSIPEYQAAIKLDMPDPAGPARTPAQTADAYRQLGRIRQAKNQLISAVANFRASLRLAPDDAPTHDNLADALYDRGFYDSAAAEYRAALRLDPAGRGVDLSAVHENLGNCELSRKRYAPAVAEYRAAVRLTPNDFSPHYNLGLALYGLGRYAESIREYREALRLNPRFAPARNGLGTALYDSGQREAGRVEWRRVLRMGDADAADLAQENLGDSGGGTLVIH
jgi:tetratricopeptide (TPR) repeat protein